MAVGNPNRAKAEKGIIRWIDDRFSSYPNVARPHVQVLCIQEL